MRFVGEGADECIGSGFDSRRLRIVNVILGMHGQVLLDGIVDELKVLGHTRVREVRAIAIEQIIAVGTISVPVDNAYILVARGGVGDGLVRGPDPRLRATRVYKYDNTLLAGVAMIASTWASVTKPLVPRAKTTILPARFCWI